MSTYVFALPAWSTEYPNIKTIPNHPTDYLSCSWRAAQLCGVQFTLWRTSFNPKYTNNETCWERLSTQREGSQRQLLQQADFLYYRGQTSPLEELQFIFWRSGSTTKSIKSYYYSIIISNICLEHDVIFIDFHCVFYLRIFGL